MQPITYTFRLVAHAEQPLLHKQFLTTFLQATIGDKLAATKMATDAVACGRAEIECARANAPSVLIEILLCTLTSDPMTGLTANDIVMVFMPKPRDRGHAPSWYVKWAESVAGGRVWWFGPGARGRANYLASVNDVPARFAAIIIDRDPRAAACAQTQKVSRIQPVRDHVLIQRRQARTMMNYIHPMRPNPGKAEVLRLAALCWSQERMLEMCGTADGLVKTRAERIREINAKGDYGYLDLYPWDESADNEPRVQQGLDQMVVWLIAGARLLGMPGDGSAIGMILAHMTTWIDASPWYFYATCAHDNRVNMGVSNAPVEQLQERVLAIITAKSGQAAIHLRNYISDKLAERMAMATNPLVEDYAVKSCTGISDRAAFLRVIADARKQSKWVASAQ